MSKRIKGVTIVIDGETKALDKALADVNKRSRDLQSELRQVDRLLKFNPGNTELIAQKQKLLADQVENTRERLNRLKNAQEQVTEAFKRGEISEEQYRAFQREIIETESKLKHFESQLNSTKTKLEQFGDSVEKAGEKMKSVGDKMSSVGKEMSTKVTLPLAAMGGAAIKTGMDFEKSLSKVQALSGATADDMAKLEEQARELGKTTVFSASQAADAQAFLAMAGYDTNQIIASMPGLLDLAAAGQLDLGRAADITTNIMSGFNLEADKTGEVSDVLAKTAASANTSVEQLGSAMSYVAPVAAGAGISLEETAAAIGILSNAGIQGERAGTALRGMIASLQNPTGQTAKALEALGLTADDVNPSMHSLSDILKTLEEAGMDSSQAMQLVGVEAGPALLAMMSQGSKGLTEFTEELKNSDGAAKEMAETMSDNLAGKLNQMKSAFQEVGLVIYYNLLPAIEWLVEFIKQLADWFNGLSPVMQNLIIIFGVIAAAIGPVIFVLGTLISSIGSIMTVIGPLITSLGGAGGAFTALTGPIGIAIAAIAGIVTALIVAYNKIDWFRDALNEAWEKIKEYTSIAFEKIKEIISTIVSNVVDFTKDVLDKFKVFWDENGKAIMEAVKFYFEQVKSTIEMVMGIIKGIFEVVWPIISNTVKVAWEAIKLVVNTALDIILGAIQTAMKLLQGDWKGAWETIKKIAENIWKNVEGFFKNIDLFQIGKDIIQGLINGIGSMAQAVWDKAKSIANGIKNAIMGALDINSPSKVTTQLGKWTGEGFIIGMEETINDVSRTANRLAEAAFTNSNSSANNSTGSIGDAISRNMNGGQNITQKITIISPQPTSPAENARRMKQASRQLAMEWR